MSVQIEQEDGIEFENKFMAMVARFRDADKGVSGEDVEAAMLLEAAHDSRLEDLLAGRIHVAGIVDELTDVEDLEFTRGEK